MDIRTIKKLIELANETGIGEIEVKSGEDSVRISRGSSAQVAPAQVHVPAPTPITPTTPAAKPSEKTAEATETKIEPAAKPANGHEIKAPMVGTVYLSSKPGAAPFVKVGDRVNVGDTLCLIEAMKMFNKIEADCAGVISAQLVENESPVEYDQALFIIEE